ncbi:MAG: hypothetical protein EZS28_017687 [Streblomastix strix]|uniref:SPRY domain-containing protein n=1 Tax=Streblomastix strix TaxID=222440 RepID=A0A5J4VX96_9EUKA|nr:MAG: hypothetical protein EZS28_017687 [Streblomastix strix]
MSSSDLVQKIKQLEDKAKFEKERADKAVAEVAKLKNENEKLKVDMEVMRLKLENFELKQQLARPKSEIMLPIPQATPVVQQKSLVPSKSNIVIPPIQTVPPAAASKPIIPPIQTKASEPESSSKLALGPMKHKHLLQSLEGVKVDGETYTNTKFISSVVLFDPVISSGVVRFEVQDTMGLIKVGIADWSIIYGPKEHPGSKGWEKISFYDCEGKMGHFGGTKKGLRPFYGQKYRIAMELNMMSNPRYIAYYCDNKLLKVYDEQIPQAVRFWAYFSENNAQFTITQFESLPKPTLEKA